MHNACNFVSFSIVIETGPHDQHASPGLLADGWKLQEGVRKNVVVHLYLEQESHSAAQPHGITWQHVHGCPPCPQIRDWPHILFDVGLSLALNIYACKNSLFSPVRSYCWKNMKRDMFKCESILSLQSFSAPIVWLFPYAFRSSATSSQHLPILSLLTYLSIVIDSAADRKSWHGGIK